MIFLDQLNRAVDIPRIPNRIVSLVPSQTELLHDLGLGERVVGITKFCIHPNEWFRNKKRVGGTKDFKLELIKELKPDLIIANKEENTKEGLEELAKKFPVWISDVKNMNDALGMIRGLGLILDKIDEAEEMVSIIMEKKMSLNTPIDYKKCIYLIWQKPYMTIGGDTFIDSMLQFAGFKNTYHHLSRYPSITLEDIKTSDASHILLSSEPFPFKEKHVNELESSTGKKVILVDGESFSWYGSRLLKAWDYFSILQQQLN